MCETQGDTVCEFEPIFTVERRQEVSPSERNIKHGGVTNLIQVSSLPSPVGRQWFRVCARHRSRLRLSGLGFNESEGEVPVRLRLMAGIGVLRWGQAVLLRREEILFGHPGITNDSAAIADE